MSAQDGGPAFPVFNDPGSREFAFGALTHGGMKLRDHFAGLAMQAMIAGAIGTGKFSNSSESLPAAAYDMADAMLKARYK